MVLGVRSICQPVSDVDLFILLYQHQGVPKFGNARKGKSPSWERRGSSEENHGTAPTTPGRSKMRSSCRGDEAV